MSTESPVTAGVDILTDRVVIAAGDRCVSIERPTSGQSRFRVSLSASADGADHEAYLCPTEDDALVMAELLLAGERPPTDHVLKEPQDRT